METESASDEFRSPRSFDSPVISTVNTHLDRIESSTAQLDRGVSLERQSDTV